jgi:hypothetical protein
MPHVKKAFLQITFSVYLVNNFACCILRGNEFYFVVLLLYVHIFSCFA